MKLNRTASISALVLALAVAGCSREPAPASSAAQGPNGQPAQAAQPAGGAAPAPAGQPAASAQTPAAVQPQTGAAPDAAPLAAPAAAAATPAGGTPSPRTFTLAEDRPLRVKVFTEVTTKTAKAGDTFRAFLAAPITDGDWAIAAEGAEVVGVVQESDPGGRVKGRASLTVSLQSLELTDGTRVNLRTTSYGVEAKSGAKKDAAKIGIGTVAGAGVGAVVGGKKGAAVGAVVGGGTATGVTLATRGAPAVIRAGALITFRLQEPVTVTKKD